MNKRSRPPVQPVAIDEDCAPMMVYARSAKGRAKIAAAEAEIAAGRGIVVDDAWFASLKARRVKRQPAGAAMLSRA